MTKEVKLLAVVPHHSLQSKENTKYTAYLFNKELMILLPIKVNSRGLDTLIAAFNHKKPEQMHTLYTIRKIIDSLEGSIREVSIYFHNNKNYYALINLAFKDKTYSIDVDVIDALSIAILYNSIVTTEKGVLTNQGVEINGEMLENALIQT